MAAWNVQGASKQPFSSPTVSLPSPSRTRGIVDGLSRCFLPDVDVLHLRDVHNIHFIWTDLTRPRGCVCSDDIYFAGGWSGNVEIQKTFKIRTLIVTCIQWYQMVVAIPQGPFPRGKGRTTQLIRGRCTELSQDVVAEFERRFLDDQLRQGQTLTLPKSPLKLTSRDVSNGTHGRMKRQLQPLARPTNVYFHVISSDGTVDNGNIPEEQLIQQVDAMNMGFAETGINFVLAGVDRTISSDWFVNSGPGSDQQDAMKGALRRGGRSDLNVYTVGFTNPAYSGLLGYATFPQSYRDAPLDDGVVILYSALPGGTTHGYDQGKTAVHETGHWFGLYHTFQGSCIAPGDYVEDTPPEGIPSEGCAAGRITCPLADLVEDFSDPINNYMDYSPDSCMAQFSPGQALRARVQGQFYRGIY